MIKILESLGSGKERRVFEDVLVDEFDDSMFVNQAPVQLTKRHWDFVQIVNELFHAIEGIIFHKRIFLKDFTAFIFRFQLAELSLFNNQSYLFFSSFSTLI